MVKWLSTSFIPFTELLNCFESQVTFRLHCLCDIQFSKMLETPFLVLPPHLRIENADAAESIWKTVATKPPDLRLKIPHTETKLQLPFFTSIFFIFLDNIFFIPRKMPCVRVCTDSQYEKEAKLLQNFEVKKECESCVAIIHVEPVLYQKVMNYFHFNTIRVSSVIKRYSYHMVKTNRLVKKASTTVLTRLIEISKQYCIVTMFSMKCIICMDMITKTDYITKKLASLLPVKLNRGYSDFNFRGIVLQWVKSNRNSFDFTFNIYRQLKKNAKSAFYMADNQEMYPLQFHKRSFVIFYSYLTPYSSNVKNYFVDFISSVAWGVACGYIFENLENFHEFEIFAGGVAPSIASGQIFCLKHCLGRSLRVSF
ncbi:hypothetical protein T08_10458 [Trichinella sp. T8]|nr:hypothetical protein T08_10458 [Trichinella sp. T8]